MIDVHVPPQNLEAELSTLGSMMIDRGALETGLNMLRAEDFYRPANQEIFAALDALAARNEPCDLITVQEELRKRGKLEECGGTEYLMSAIDAVPTAANIEHYAAIVEEKALRRRLIAAATRIVAEARREDPDTPVETVLAEAEKAVLEVGTRRNRAAIRRLGEVCGELYGVLADLNARCVVPISVKPIADQCHGMMRGELIVLAGATSAGKSSLAMQLLLGAARSNPRYPSALITCEMTEDQVGLRAIAGGTRIPLRRILKGDLDEEHYSRIGDWIADIYEDPVFVVKAVDKTVGQLAGICRRLVAQGIQLIAVDHMQRICPERPNATEYETLTLAARVLKNTAVDLGVPIIAVSQLRRPDARGASKPTRHDLRGSGHIEENADQVWLLWREVQDDDGAGQARELTNAELIVAKGRMLGTGVVKLLFHGGRYMFFGLEDRNG